MPDTLKQIYSGTINVTGLTGNQTATLFTNNATTRVVIKDVDVTNTFPVVPNLTVGGVAVASLNTNLTGSEIVDVSQSVAFSFPAALSYTSSSLSYANGGGIYRSATTFRINGNTASTANFDQTLPTAVESYSPFLYTSPDGDVFQVATDGNSRWFLYKYAGSAGGTQTTVNTGNTTNYTPVAFDGINTFYWLSSTTNLRIFNADTETTTNVTIAAVTAGSTNPRLLFSNGYLLWLYTDGANPVLIEVSTGRWLNCTGAAMSVDNFFNFMGFYFNPTTRVVTTLYYYNTGNLYYRHISPAIPALTAGSASFGTSWPSATLASGSFQGRSAAASSSHVYLTSGDGGVINDGSTFPCVLSGLSGATSGWRVTGPLASVNASYWRPRALENSNPTVNTTNFPSTISLRITGVEVTP